MPLSLGVKLNGDLIGMNAVAFKALAVARWNGVDGLLIHRQTSEPLFQGRYADVVALAEQLQDKDWHCEPKPVQGAAKGTLLAIIEDLPPLTAQTALAAAARLHCFALAAFAERFD